MATAKQACDILDKTLRVPDGTARWLADRLRLQGLLPSTQGRAEQIGSDHAAIILLAVLLGGATRVADYTRLRHAGRLLTDVLGDFLDDPTGFIEMRLDLLSPEAAITFADGDDIAIATFAADTLRPAFDRFAIVGADALSRLSNALKSAPPVRHGRRRAAERYRRIERAVTF